MLLKNLAESSLIDECKLTDLQQLKRDICAMSEQPEQERGSTLQVLVTGLSSKTLAQLAHSALIEAVDLIHLCLQGEQKLAFSAQFLLCNLLYELL